jgi:hypothetical protein
LTISELLAEGVAQRSPLLALLPALLCLILFILGEGRCRGFVVVS